MARSIRYHDQLKLQKRKHFIRKVLFVLAIVIIACGVLVYGLFFAKLLDVRQISVTLAENSNADLATKMAITDFANDWLKQKRFFIKHSNNMFLLNGQEFSAAILQNYPKLDSVIIKKHYFHRLDIEARERNSLGIWCLTKQGHCFYFDQKGIIYDNAPDTSGFLLFDVQDERERTVTLGQKIEQQIWLDGLSLARRNLAEQGFQIKELVIPEDSFDEFYAVESRGWKIKMSINTNLESQIRVMADFFKQKLTPDRISQLQYVDLRIADRIYYK